MMLPRWPWRRIIVWSTLLILAHFLRALLPLLFLTFIFSYIANKVVVRLLRIGPYRRFHTTLVFLSFFAIFAIFVSFAMPQVHDEARRGAQLMADKIQERADGDARPPMTSMERGGRFLLGTEIYDQLAGSPFARRILDEGEQMALDLFERFAVGVGDFVAGGIRLIFHTLLAGLLAFIIVWDLPRIQAGLALLESGKFGKQYREIRPMIVSFLAYIGQAFQGLIVVAAINGLQMIPILWFFDVPKIALLSTIVFFFSFVPIFGVLVAFIPVALVVFQAGGGELVAIIALLYFGLNILETYTINAWIMGLFLRSHVLLVLVLLLAGEHLFGIWGLLLAVPIGHYIVEYGLLDRKAAF